MKAATVIALAIVYIAVSNSFAVANSRTVLAEDGEQQRTATTQSKQDLNLVEGQLTTYQDYIRNRFRNGEFGWLDRHAHDVRTSKDRLDGGYWKLSAMYSALSQPQTKQPSDVFWEDHIRKLQSWAKERPDSITARVALATAWAAYAWRARGSGHADSVSETAWKVFDERLSIAANVLYEARSLKEKCPHWYVTSLRVALGQGWDRDSFDRLFEEGVELEPTYYYLHQVKAMYLLPRWYGEDGEWEEFAEQSAKRVGGNQGDIIFFAIYSMMRSLHDLSFMNTRQQAGSKLLSGFRSIEKLYGSSPERLNEACYFSFASNDMATARELFDRIGAQFDSTVWGSKQTYELFRSAATTQTPRRREQESSVHQNSAFEAPPL